MINFVILGLKLHVYIVMPFKFHEKSYMKVIPCGNNTHSHTCAVYVWLVFQRRSLESHAWQPPDRGLDQIVLINKERFTKLTDKHKDMRTCLLVRKGPTAFHCFGNSKDSLQGKYAICVDTSEVVLHSNSTLYGVMLLCDKNRKYVGTYSPKRFTQSKTYAWNMHCKGDIVNGFSL